jgi:putative membrane protein
MENNPQDDPRIYLAAERTFLAWLRTGLGLMGVGFAVARFGLFLREMQASQTHTIPHSTGISVGSGVALVSLGVVVNVGSAIRHVMLVRELRSGTWQPGRVSRGAVGLAIVLGAVGVAMAVYLTWMRG